MWTRRRIVPRLRDFSGGINLTSERADNDLAFAWNMTILGSELHRRFGYTKRNGVAMSASVVQQMFQWLSVSSSVTQCGAALHLNYSATPFKTFTTNARCGLADFGGKLCIVHPVDGFFTFDGATVTAIATGPKGNTLASWQNKLYSAGDPTNKSRVTWSAIGDPTNWATAGAGTNDLREVDESQVVCLFSGQGQDIKGLPGLLAFKRGSAYRINDSTTGAYTTIDRAIGAANAMSVCGGLGRVLVLSRDGLFTTDGVSGLSSVGRKIDELWSARILNKGDAGLDQWCAIAFEGHAYFSVTKQGSVANDLMIEYHIGEGWFTFNSNAASAYAAGLTAFTPDGTQLLSGSPTVPGQVYTQRTYTDDDGAAIHAYAQTRWIEPYWGLRARINQVRINGHGSFTLYPLYDYDNTQTTSRALSFPAGSATVHGGYQDIYTLGAAKAFSFRVEATGSGTNDVEPLVADLVTGTVPAVPVGTWGLYGIDPYPFPVPLGRT